MEETIPRVLLMDDEVETADVVVAAVEALRAAGMVVETTDHMSAVYDSYYQGVHAAYVLDVDMSLVTDSVAGDGTDVSRFLRAMDDDAGVVIFSARGGVSAWFAAANHHVHGYVHKGEAGALDRLVDLVQRALVVPSAPFPPPRGSNPPARALLALEPFRGNDDERISRAITSALEGWEVTRVEGLAAVAEYLDAGGGQWGLAVLAAERFSTRPGSRRLMERVCAASPQPHAIFTCEGRQRRMASILQVVNAGPFCLLDLLSDSFEEQLHRAARRAVTWYGRAEVLRPGEEHLARLELGFSAETLAEQGLGPGGEEGDS